MKKVICYTVGGFNDKSVKVGSELHTILLAGKTFKKKNRMQNCQRQSKNRQHPSLCRHIIFFSFAFGSLLPHTNDRVKSMWRFTQYRCGLTISNNSGSGSFDSGNCVIEMSLVRLEHCHKAQYVDCVLKIVSAKYYADVPRENAWKFRKPTGHDTTAIFLAGKDDVAGLAYSLTSPACSAEIAVTRTQAFP